MGDISVNEMLHVLFAVTSPERDAVHEAGHRFMWRLVFPKVKTHYGYSVDGYPGVIPEKNMGSVVLESLTLEEASKWIYIKLGGFASEILFLGWSDMADKIAEQIVLDWFDWEAGHGRFDWEEEIHIGDIPNVVSIIKSKSEWTLDIAMRNFKGFFKSCIENMQDNPREYAEECRKAMKFFVKRK